MMRKYLPLILVGAGVLIAVIAVVVVVKKNFSGGSNNNSSEDATVPEIPQSQWPIVSLTPTSDPTVANSLGHFLELKVQKINIPNAKTMDYELVYSTTNGGQQGVPGTVSLSGDVDRKLLLGSESSGKFRFDNGIDHGTITLRFRDGNGKLLGKLSSDFTYKFENGIYSLTMNTFTNGTQTFTSK